MRSKIKSFDGTLLDATDKVPLLAKIKVVWFVTYWFVEESVPMRNRL
jgi:hypothetical protein